MKGFNCQPVIAGILPLYKNKNTRTYFTEEELIKEFEKLVNSLNFKNVNDQYKNFLIELMLIFTVKFRNNEFTKEDYRDFRKKLVTLKTQMVETSPDIVLGIIKSNKLSKNQKLDKLDFINELYRSSLSFCGTINRGIDYQDVYRNCNELIDSDSFKNMVNEKFDEKYGYLKQSTDLSELYDRVKESFDKNLTYLIEHTSSKLIRNEIVIEPYIAGVVSTKHIQKVRNKQKYRVRNKQY